MEDEALALLVKDALAKDCSFFLTEVLQGGAQPGTPGSLGGAETVDEMTCQRLLGILFADMLKTKRPKQ